MGIGVSVFLLTVGAILKFAITVEVTGVDIQAMGTILMIVGAAWLVISLVLMRRRGVEGQNQQIYDDSGHHGHGPPAV